MATSVSKRISPKEEIPYQVFPPSPEAAGGDLWGKILALVVRNSTIRQKGNWSSVVQEGKLGEKINKMGGTVYLFDEQATSGRDLSKRPVALHVLDKIERGEVHGLATFAVNRLTRNEFMIDGGVIARRLIEARALLVTWDRTYELWNEGHLIPFQVECFLAGIDVRTIRRQTWRGILGRADAEPFFTQVPFGFKGEVVEATGPSASGGTERKLKRRPALDDDPRTQTIMAEMVRLFDECSTLGEVCRRLNTPGPDGEDYRPLGNREPWIGQPRPWSVARLKFILKNPVYWGEWQWGRHPSKDGKPARTNVVWEDWKGHEMRHDLGVSCWDARTARRWREKFAGASQAGRRFRKHVHPLLGVLACSSCGGLMVAKGTATESGVRRYQCPRFHDPQGCVKRQVIQENAAVRALRTVLPEAIVRARSLVEAMRAQARAGSKLDALREELAMKKEQLEVATADWFKAPSGVRELLNEGLERVKAELDALEAQVEHEAQREAGTDDLEALIDALRGDPAHIVEALDDRQVAVVSKALLTGVRIQGSGWARGRTHRVIEGWTLREYGVTDAISRRSSGP